jgi:hypothetical protein
VEVGCVIPGWILRFDLRNGSSLREWTVARLLVRARAALCRFGEDQGGEAGPAPAAKDDNWKEGKALAEVLFR